MPGKFHIKYLCFGHTSVYLHYEDTGKTFYACHDITLSIFSFENFAECLYTQAHVFVHTSESGKVKCFFFPNHSLLPPWVQRRKLRSSVLRDKNV